MIPGAADSSGPGTPRERRRRLVAPQHELLLQAALLPDERALSALHRWRALVEPPGALDPGRTAGLAGLDAASVRLLPLLVDNVTRFGVLGPGDPLGDQLRDEQRRSFYDYHLLVRRCRPVFAVFDAADMAHLLLKGAALAALYYRNPALRPMEDLDVLVPLDRADEAVHLLTGLGWRAGRPLDDFAREKTLVHSLGFAENDGRGALDLHWRPLYDGFDAEGDRRMWARSVPVTLDGIATRTFDATDHLFHACVHGMRWNGLVSPIRWIADVEMVLRAGGVDWDRLATEADARGLGPTVVTALEYVDGRFGTSLPHDALAAVGRRHPTPYGRVARWVRTTPPSAVSAATEALVVNFVDRTRGMTTTQRIRAYPRYLRAAFGQNSLGGVIRRLVSAPGRRRRAQPDDDAG